MAKIKVGSGFGKITFQAALQRSKPGDLLVLDPGRYNLDQVPLFALGLHGNGTADQVEITGSFTINGHCTFTNLTVRAMPYKNAFFVQSPNNMASLSSCIIHGEPGAKYPAVWCEGGTLVLNQVTALSDPDQYAIRITENAKLHATASQLGRLGVKAAKADLIDSATSYLDLTDGARASTFGAHRCFSLPGKRVLGVSGHSVAHFSRLVLGGEYEEGFAQDSIVHIDSVVQEESGSFSVMTKDGARVITASSAVDVVDLDAKPSEPTPPAGPKTIRWRVQQAHEFSTKIAPQLGSGDTVVMEEGDYTLDDYDCLLLGANLTGQGQRLTKLHGTIAAIASGKTTVSNLTICAPSPELHAVCADQSGAQLTLENVTLQSAPNSQAAALFASAGTVSLKGCKVAASSGEAGTQGQVLVVANTEFKAQKSNLGWFYAEHGAQTTLSDCTSYKLSANSGATINAVDKHHILANECDQYELEAGVGGVLKIQALTTSSDGLHARLDGGAISLADFGSAEDETFTVHNFHGEIGGIDPSTYNLYVPDENDELILEHEATRGRTAQQQGDAGLLQPLSDAADDDVVTSGSSHPIASDGDSPAPLAELNTLVGLGKVKLQVQGFVNTVKLRQRRAHLGLPAEDEFTLHSMFLGNPGTGKTTVARLIGKAMYQAGVVENDSFVEAGRAQLVSANIGGTAKQTRALLESGRGGVIFIDEAYSLASEDSAGFAEEAVTEILAFMENHRGDTMVILAGYNEKMHELLALNEGLKSRIKHRFDFEDYSPAEIAEIGLNELARGQYTVNEELYRRIIGTAYAQSPDRSNARWVRNFNQDLRATQGERVILIDDPTRDDLTSILVTDLHAIAGGDPESRETKLAESLAELDAMTGLAPVKEWVRSLADLATVNQRLVELDGSMERPNYHVAFTGNPGTGKTTVARIVAEIFYSLQILPTPAVKSVPASKLLGRYLGHSTDNTNKAFDAAMGGVLFVDEAHQLRAKEHSNNALQQEVVDAMITRLEDDRDKFVAVFAGYTDQMHEFFESDPGLKSRIPAEIEFPDYTSAEVAEIATAVLSKNWQFNIALFTEVAVSAYDSLPMTERSNGRWARSFAEKVVSRHNTYLVNNDVYGQEMHRIPDEVLLEFAP